MTQRVFPLVCAIQNYAWGKIGLDSEVAKLAQCQSTNTAIDPQGNYAEFWFGDHPNGPSRIQHADGTLELLKEHIQKDPENALGADTAKEFDNGLPFLFKVLSINSALSIQAHPNKELARKLHVAEPTRYKDPNHKPELALALTPMEALCGFRPYTEILSFFKTEPELAIVAGEEATKKLAEAGKDGASVEQQKEALKNLLQTLVTRDDSTIKEQIGALMERIKDKRGTTYTLLKRLQKEYPTDVGIFIVFLLNYIELAPGTSIFLGPNQPHAYLSGDCVECMARSDNVIRAGFTPKYKDVKTLTSMLTYECAKVIPSSGVTQGKHLTLFTPPVTDFKVVKINLNKGESVTLEAEKGPTILLTYEGTGELKTGDTTLPLSKGKVFFVYSATKVVLEASDTLSIFKATSNL